MEFGFTNGQDRSQLGRDSRKRHQKRVVGCFDFKTGHYPEKGCPILAHFARVGAQSTSPSPDGQSRQRVGQPPSLDEFPERCPLAPESPVFPFEVRQLLYGHPPHEYRILFTIEAKTVYVLHVRHGRRQPLKQ